MKTADAPEIIEIIEIIDEETDVFGGRRHDVTIHATHGPRWAGPAAVVALVGLIAYGVATSTSTSAVRTPKSAPASTTSVATATSTLAPAAPAQPGVPHYAADPPPQFTVQYAEGQQFVNDFGLVGYELWATPDASATTGSWFSITTHQGASAVYAADSYRLQAGTLSIGMSHTTGGHTLLQFTTDDHVGVTIASYGWSDDSLVRLAASVHADAHGLGFTDNWFTSDHQIISSAQPWLAVRGLPMEQVAYTSSPDLGDAVVVTVARPLLQGDGASPDDRRIALRFLLDRTTPFSVDGHSAVAGTVIGDGSYSIATWIAGDYIVTVGATLPVSQVIAIARTVHQVSAVEWADMQLQADEKSADRRAGKETPAVPVSFGSDASGEPWTIEVAMASYGDREQINWSWGTDSGATTPGDNATINTLVDDQRTYVLADLPRTVAQVAELRVLRDGLDPMIVPFRDIDPTLDRTFAAFAFSEVGPYTAQIVAPDGAVLATWPPP